ncbi:MAG: hypothetical protein SBU_001588 [Candidatus Syntrophoarchaeum butanivorans]|uniref:Uncharacterized protein n=1 Tax=Candidatus Syntropharchaeum butanivorans TaxID=1839936 RepID=A0A1F2P2Y1_9EURY|nr:MAG: hypothetical protein SBU_001588 [Candidatus Syntrophoarchaeum butanivorans]
MVLEVSQVLSTVIGILILLSTLSITASLERVVLNQSEREVAQEVAIQVLRSVLDASEGRGTGESVIGLDLPQNIGGRSYSIVLKGENRTIAVLVIRDGDTLERLVMEVPYPIDADSVTGGGRRCLVVEKTDGKVFARLE